ncbi:MAG TPA: MFS transporter [Lachnospiraceae bacterium]|nr:MFS transporter [Lachnospiraceae bacterium]
MKKQKETLFETLSEMRAFLLLWLTQAFSGLGSAMTGYCLVIWSYSQKGSALMTSLLMVCSYAPYVLFSIFAGALSDRWDKKKTMLVCDTVAAATTVAMVVLLQNDLLQIWHLYLINVVNGLMNTVQQPASEVAVTRLLPKKHYQRVGGLRYLSSSVNSILTPIIATAVLGLAGMGAVVAFDLFSFVTAFLVLLFAIKIPEGEAAQSVKGMQPEEAVQSMEGRQPAEAARAGDSLLKSVGEGIAYLKRERGIFDLILFLAAINLVASIYDAAFPAMLLSREGGSEKVLGMVNAVIGFSTLAGSLIASWVKAPKSRVRVICNCLLFSMSFENFMLALGRTPLVWCIGGFLGWIAIPLMNANLDVILRLRIPDSMQGRVYSVRNSLQFFTIPLGYFMGGLLVDAVFEPVMAIQKEGSLLVRLFGEGKGSGAAFLFFVIAFAGIGVCLYFRHDRHIWELEK